MGDRPFTTDDYHKARADYGVTQSSNVTRHAEERARKSGRLSEIVDPAINPIRRSLIRFNPHRKRWIVTIGCPIDIEVGCDTTGSMGGEVDRAMAILPNLYGATAKVLPGYDPQLCLGIFGDCGDPFVMCRPQFEMEAPKIVEYLKEMAPQRGGCANHGEDPQYSMFARAYLTDAYTNRIGLKGYHFIVTDEPCHNSLRRDEVKRIFGENIFDEELKDMHELPSVEKVVEELKAKAHTFALVLKKVQYSDTIAKWKDLYGDKNVIVIDSTRQLPEVISATIGLTEGTLDIGELNEHLGDYASNELVRQLSNIEIGAQAKLRHALPYPVPQKGDIFASKSDLWPIQENERASDLVVGMATKPFMSNDEVRYL